MGFSCPPRLDPLHIPAGHLDQIWAFSFPSLVHLHDFLFPWRLMPRFLCGLLSCMKLSTETENSENFDISEHFFLSGPRFTCTLVS